MELSNKKYDDLLDSIYSTYSQQKKMLLEQ